MAASPVERNDATLQSSVSSSLSTGPMGGRTEIVEAEKQIPLREDDVEVVGLDGIDDPYSSSTFSPFARWSIVLIICMGSLIVTSASSMAPSTYRGVQAEFGSSEEVTILSLSLFVIGLGFMPLVLSPLSEFFGRSPIYITGFTLFFIFNTMTAFSNNTATFLISRLLTGAAGSGFISVAGGTISDIFGSTEVGTPMAVFTASIFIGPGLGALISSFINSTLDWRWTWRIMMIWSAVEWLAIVICIPETFQPARLRTKAVALRKKLGRTDLKAPIEMDDRSILQEIVGRLAIPFQILILEPMALLLCIATAILLGIIYMFFSAFDIIYAAHGFTSTQVGLVFIGQIVGVSIGSASQGLWNRYYSTAICEEATGKPAPEEHLRKGVAGAIMLPISLFWFAFTLDPSIHWSVSAVASVFFGISIIWTFQAAFTFLVDAYRPVAASAMAANSFLRGSFAAGFPLFTPAMYRTLGSQWATALCAFLTLIFFPLPFYLFFRYGARLRRGSKFAQQP